MSRRSRLGDLLTRSERVGLRYPERRDRAEYLALRRASLEHLRPWEPAPARGRDLDHPRYFDRDLELARAGESERLLVVAAPAEPTAAPPPEETRQPGTEPPEPGTILGRVAINHIARGPLQSCVLGYWTGAPFAGRGYMTEAVRLTLDHCFGRLRLHRVEANIVPGNEASRQVLVRNGFRLEGFSPRYLEIAGRWADHERYAITAEEHPREPRSTHRGASRTPPTGDRPRR